MENKATAFFVGLNADLFYQSDGPIRTISEREQYYREGFFGVE
ncbi:MAG: hypothetical protein ABIS36_16360 [Chryseolinea sp.]